MIFHKVLYCTIICDSVLYCSIFSVLQQYSSCSMAEGAAMVSHMCSFSSTMGFGP